MSGDFKRDASCGLQVGFQGTWTHVAHVDPCEFSRAKTEYLGEVNGKMA